MRRILANLGCLILSILLLPLFLILVGPLLALAALRGRQPAGPIMLDTLRYGLFGRIGAFMLGLALWILVWSGLAWVVINGVLPSATVTAIPAVTPSVAGSPVKQTPAIEPQNETPTLPQPTATTTPTSLPPTFTPGTTTPTVAVATNTPTPLPNLTPTLITDTSAAANHDTIQRASTPPPEINETGVLTISLSVADQEAVIAAVQEGNRLLRQTMSSASQENIQQLETVWQDQALSKAQNFASAIYERYAKPFAVQFEYITLPTINSQRAADQVTVITQEDWSYQGRAGIDRETLEFIYTLNKRNGRWVIVQYGYHNLPTPVPPSTPDSSQ